MPFWYEKTTGIRSPAEINCTLQKGQVMARVKSDVSPLERLRQAAGKGDVRSVTDLLNQGINSSDKDKDGRTLLHIAAQNGHVDVVKALVARGYDTSSKDSHGYTPMHRAAAQGHLEVIEFLTKNGCPVDEEDECGNTALHAAAWNGFSQTIDLLLRNKSRVNAVNKAGFTALHSAAQKGHNQSARVLLFAGCQPNIKNKYAETALHTSARYGHAGVARILLSAKCKVNVQNKNGETALHVAVVCKRQKIAKLLVEAGIKKKLKNKQGETALDISRKMNDLEMILILTSQEKAIVIRRHRSEDIRQLSSPAEDTISDTKSDSSRKHRRNSQSRQETDKENYQTIGSCVAGPAAAGAKATKSSCTAVPSGAMAASNRLLFDSIDAPEKLLDRFKQHQLEKQMKQLPNTAAAPNKHSKNEKMMKDLLCEHTPKPGQMYYRDLSGKVKQGPVGCTSVYEAGPTLLQKERKNNSADHDAFYEPIASARDYQKTEKCCHQRLPNQQGNGGVHGRNSCTTLSRVQKSTMSVEGRRSRVQSEPRLSSRSHRSTDHNLRGQQVQEGSCDCCCSNVVIHTAERRVATPDVYAYGFIESHHPYGVAAENFSPPGRLFKSRSDETLSAHSGRRRHHQSTRHRKTKAPHIDTSGDRYWTMSKAQSRAREASRDHQGTSIQTRTDCRPYTYHEENDYILPSTLRLDRSTEDTSRGFPAQVDRKQDQFSNLASTVRENVEESYQNYGEVFRGSAERLNSSEIVFGPRSLSNDMSSASKGPGLPLSQSSPFVVEEQLSDAAEVFRSSPCADPPPGSACHSNTPATSPVCTACRHDAFCSLQSTSNHPRADAGSNPDSGYGSKSYRTRGDLVMVFQPQDSNSSGKESKLSREDDKTSYGSSHWNTSECTVAPRIPHPNVAVCKPSENNTQIQQPSSRKPTSHRQPFFREITSPSCSHSRHPSTNDESLKPVSPQNLHAFSKNGVATVRCPSERPTSWCGQHQEPSRSRMANTFNSNQTHHGQPVEVYDGQIHQGMSRDVITEDATTHSTGNAPRPAKPSKHRDRPTSYQQYEPTATRHNQRSCDQPVQQNDRFDQSDKLRYGRQHSERDVRQGSRQETPRQRHELHTADVVNATEQVEFHRTENLQSKVYSASQGGHKSVLEIGRSTTV